MVDYTEIFGEDEVSSIAMGGTELMKMKLMKTVDHDLLKKHQIIVSRPRDNHFATDKKKILWIHDHHFDTEATKFNDKDYQDRFDYFVFVSYHQMNNFQLLFGLEPEKCVVLKNALTDPIDVNIMEKWKSKNKIDIVYTSTPQRGLSILYEVFKELYEEYGDYIKLHVYSSFDIYGHYQRNTPFEDLYEKCRKHTGIEYYGSVDHASVTEALKATDIWCLPSIWPETSCIAAMEAMSAGNLLVHSCLGALPETTANFSITYPYVRNLNDHAGLLYQHLKDSIDTIKNNRDSLLNHLIFQKLYADSFYSWDIRAKEWSIFLQSI